MNHKQVLSIILAVLGVVMISTTQLSELVGPNNAKWIVSAAGFANSILAAIMAVVSSQAGLVKDVQAMPGVESIVVNRDANSTLATMAVDPAERKVEVKQGDSIAVNKTANNAP